MGDHPRFKADELRHFARQVLLKCDLPAEDADISANILIDTDLRGIDSHGIAHLPAHPAYVKGLQSGMVDPRAPCRTVRESPTTALVDGNSGFGLVVAHKSMKLAIGKAQESGVGMVTVTNSHHLGAAGYYSMMALPHDMIGISMTNAAPAVLPTFGRERRLGTNALTFAVPAGAEPPYVLDMATSAVAVGKLEIARRKGDPIPLGWAVDGDGTPTTDPNHYWQGGALLPLGSSAELSSYKGYGLAMLVDILAGVLSGVGFSAALSREHRYSGHFFGAIRIDCFRPVDEFKSMMDEMIGTLHSTPPALGEERVLVPGQKEHETFLERSRKGIPLHHNVIDSLKALAEELELDFPSPHNDSSLPVQ